MLPLRACWLSCGIGSGPLCQRLPAVLLLLLNRISKQNLRNRHSLGRQPLCANAPRAVISHTLTQDFLAERRADARPKRTFEPRAFDTKSPGGPSTRILGPYDGNFGDLMRIKEFLETHTSRTPT